VADREEEEDDDEDGLAEEEEEEEKEEPVVPDAEEGTLDIVVKFEKEVAAPSTVIGGAAGWGSADEEEVGEAAKRSPPIDGSNIIRSIQSLTSTIYDK
jgi:hypothetical protein